MVMILFGLFISIRFAPCVADAGYVGWRTWGRIAPNLVCALDLSGHPELTEAEIDARIGDFTNLTSLDLSRNNLSAVPDNVMKLVRLKTLILNDNNLTSLPDSLGALATLQALHVENNQLTTFPRMGGGLVSLDLSGNNLHSVGSGLESLQGLQNLDLSNNEFSSMPSLGVLPELENIDLSLNALTSSAQSSVQAEIPDVSIVFVSNSSASSSLSSAVSEAASGVSSSLASSDDIPSAASSSPTSSSSSFTSSSSLSASSMSVPSETPDPGCVRNFQLNDYSFCIPETWQATTNGLTATFTDEHGDDVANIRCPIQQTDYQQWTLATRTRTYTRNGETYGADEWTGTKPETGDTAGFLIVFMHKNDMSTWFGNTYQDIRYSCQIQSLQPNINQNIFRLIYLSIY